MQHRVFHFVMGMRCNNNYLCVILCTPTYNIRVFSIILKVYMVYGFNALKLICLEIVKLLKQEYIPYTQCV